MEDEPALPSAQGGAGAARPHESELASVVHRNIRSLLELRAATERRKSLSVRIADTITRFTGSMASVALHLVIFGGWIVVNAGVVPGVEPFDPFPFVMLAMFASVEAIFLSTFVLVSQNRMAEMSERRAELDLQINLLAEHEVTRIIELVDAIAEHVGVARRDVDDLKRDVRPEQVVEALDQKGEDGESRRRPR